MVAMAPKLSRSGNLSVSAASTRTLAERRALLGIVPASTNNGPPSVAAVALLIRSAITEASFLNSASGGPLVMRLPRSQSIPPGPWEPHCLLLAFRISRILVAQTCPLSKNARRGGTAAGAWVCGLHTRPLGTISIFSSKPPCMHGKAKRWQFKKGIAQLSVVPTSFGLLFLSPGLGREHLNSNLVSPNNTSSKK